MRTFVSSSPQLWRFSIRRPIEDLEHAEMKSQRTMKPPKSCLQRRAARSPHRVGAWVGGEGMRWSGCAAPERSPASCESSRSVGRNATVLRIGDREIAL